MEYQKVCKNCGKSFIAKTKNKAYCCIECSEESNKKRTIEWNRKNYEKKKAEREVPIVCPCCGKTFVRANMRQRFCSPKCCTKFNYEYRKQTLLELGFKSEERECLFCGEKFEAKSNNQKFCSEKCYGAWYRRERSKKDFEEPSEKKKTSALSIGEIMKIGNKYRLSYGKTVDALERGIIPP